MRAEYEMGTQIGRMGFSGDPVRQSCDSVLKRLDKRENGTAGIRHKNVHVTVSIQARESWIFPRNFLK